MVSVLRKFLSVLLPSLCVATLKGRRTDFAECEMSGESQNRGSRSAQGRDERTADGGFVQKKERACFQKGQWWRKRRKRGREEERSVGSRDSPGESVRRVGVWSPSALISS